jgi:hypothetical protein
MACSACEEGSQQCDDVASNCDMRAAAQLALAGCLAERTSDPAAVELWVDSRLCSSGLLHVSAALVMQRL